MDEDEANTVDPDEVSYIGALAPKFEMHRHGDRFVYEAHVCIDMGTGLYTTSTANLWQPFGIVTQPTDGRSVYEARDFGPSGNRTLPIKARIYGREYWHTISVGSDGGALPKCSRSHRNLNPAPSSELSSSLNSLACHGWLSIHVYCSTVNSQTKTDGDILQSNSSLAHWKVESVSLLTPSFHQCSHQSMIDLYVP